MADVPQRFVDALAGVSDPVLPRDGISVEVVCVAPSFPQDLCGYCYLAEPPG
jgi:hypothetical protein